MSTLGEAKTKEKQQTAGQLLIRSLCNKMSSSFRVLLSYRVVGVATPWSHGTLPNIDGRGPQRWRR
jgi:hypothetical protein